MSHSLPPKFSCPSCSAPLQFQSAVSVFTVCSYCRSTIVRRDDNLALMGTMAALKEDFSPLQLGTRGIYRGNHFALVGRIMRRWSAGSWNEWLAYFDDARTGWLAEAQGFYAFSFAVPAAVAPPLADLEPGREIALADTIWTVADCKITTCGYSEGELPFAAVAGRKTTTVDLSSRDGRFACIEYADDDKDSPPPLIYQGEYLSFDELKLTNLRELDGW